MGQEPDRTLGSAAQALLDGLLEGCQLIGPDWRYLYVNHSAARHGRTTPEQLIGRTMMEAYPGIEHTAVFSRIRECMEQRTPSLLENEFQFPDGQTGWFELRVEPTPQGVAILSVDITAKKRAEAAHWRTHRALTTLSDCNQTLVRALDEQRFLHDVCAIAVNKGGYRWAWIGERPSETSDAERVLASAGIETFGIAAVSLVYRVHGRVKGALTLQCDDPNAFDEAEIDLLAELALDLGHGLQTLRDRDAAKRSTERIAHLTTVLAAARRVSQVVVREHDRDRLLRSACDVLAESLAFDACCIGVLEGDRLRFAADAGVAAKRQALRAIIEARDIPDVAHRPITADLPAYVQDGDTIGVRIEHKEKVYGVIFVALPRAAPEDQEATRLLREVAADVGFALRSIDNEHRRAAAEQALQASHDRWHAFMDASPALAWVKDDLGRMLYVNRAMERAFGVSQREWSGKTVFDFLPREVAQVLADSDLAVLTSGEALEAIESTGDLGGLQQRWQTAKFRFGSGSGARFLGGVAIDITERLKAEEDRKDLNARLEQLSGVVSDLSAARSLAAIGEIVRAAARSLTGADGATFVLRDGDECHYFDEDAIAPLWKGRRFPMAACVSGWAMRHGQSVVIDDIYADSRVPHDAYRPTFVKSMVMVPIRRDNPRGAIGIYWQETFRASKADVRILQALADSTATAMESVTVLEALMHSEERYRTLVENTEDIVYSLDAKGRVAYMSPSVGKYGYTPEEVTGESFARFVHPADFQGLMESLGRALSGVVEPRVFRARTKDGKERVVRGTSRVIMQNGDAIGVSGVLVDITELKRAEDQLRVAQKMEAIGQLAGGVAHDFNNLLAVILSYADFVADAVRGQGAVEDDVSEIRKAGERAAALTRQLLAFSRKQVLEPQVLDLNQLATGVERMLRRVIGEDIDLAQRLAPDLGRVKADPGQIEQVIMNLVVNARDAMPHGGKLTIETANVDIDEDHAARHGATKHGPAVMLSISDTGSGMDEVTKQRLFEPFFTTKAVGKGTGLGLSTVYGIIEQSGGSIFVYSELGVGTTFKIYLPRVTDALDARRKRELVASVVGHETILLVEDDLAVRNLAVRILKSAQYKVLSAESGAAALKVCDEHEGSIDLVVTDVVMPEMSGRQLAERLSKLRTGLRVLYMSGYTDHAIERHGVLESGIQFIAKPFTAEDLARKVREVLDTPRSVAKSVG